MRLALKTIGWLLFIAAVGVATWASYAVIMSLLFSAGKAFLGGGYV